MSLSNSVASLKRNVPILISLIGQMRLGGDEKNALIASQSIQISVKDETITAQSQTIDRLQALVDSTQAELSIELTNNPAEAARIVESEQAREAANAEVLALQEATATIEARAIAAETQVAEAQARVEAAEAAVVEKSAEADAAIAELAAGEVDLSELVEMTQQAIG
jgi:chromosome segregation ATPase